MTRTQPQFYCWNLRREYRETHFSLDFQYFCVEYIVHCFCSSFEEKWKISGELRKYMYWNTKMKKYKCKVQIYLVKVGSHSKLYKSTSTLEYWNISTYTFSTDYTLTPFLFICDAVGVIFIKVKVV